MLEAKHLDEAIEAATGSVAPAAPLKDCINHELMVWILTEIRSILFKKTGERRMSFLVSKGMLIVFVVKLAAKVADCLLTKNKAGKASDNGIIY